MLLSPVPSQAVADITGAAVEGRCTNCGAPLPEPRPRYCPACGQETHIKAPTVSEFLQQFSGTYFATEGALWRTLKLLFLQPGELTAQYLGGRRKHHVLPLRLFLSATLIMLVCMRIASSWQFSSLDDPAVAARLPERPAAISFELGFARAGYEPGRFFCENMPQWLCQRIQQRMNAPTHDLLAQLEKATDRVASHAGLVMFVLLPAFSLGLAVFFRYRGFSYTEHLVFALHLHAFWFLVVTLMVVAGPWFALVIPLYAALAFRRVYGGSVLSLSLRCTALALVHSSLVLLMVATAFLTALLV